MVKENIQQINYLKKLFNRKFRDTYKNLKVLVTGSTGFKGSWLCYWLNKLDAKVVGIGLKPEKDNILYKSFKLDNKIKQYFLDINNFNKLNNIIKKEKPDIIFHLAAQSIVSESYKNSIETIRTNTLGSTNLLEIVKLNNLKNLVFITSDKCYLNIDKKKAFNEKDILGGSDVYSSSKAAAEIIFHSYHLSFFKKKDKFLNKITARAGNVIGGGDFKLNRIIPDFFRSIKSGKKLILRNPNSTRPWQHVLEPLSGYLLLGKKILNNELKNNIYPSWNFGPERKNCKKVVNIIKMFYNEMNLKENFLIKKEKKMVEAKLLSLNINKSKKEISWSPILNLDECVKFTSDWYISYFSNENIERVTEDQIEYFSKK